MTIYTCANAFTQHPGRCAIWCEDDRRCPEHPKPEHAHSSGVRARDGSPKGRDEDSAPQARQPGRDSDAPNNRSTPGSAPTGEALTDEQIDALQHEFDCYFDDHHDFRVHDFARGVEREVRAALSTNPSAPVAPAGMPDRLLQAGAALANCAFNLAQRGPGEFTARDIKALDQCRRAWDAARQGRSMTTSTTAEPGEALGLALRFHEVYERLAPSFGYETRTDTREFDATSKNGRLMVAVCGEILGSIREAQNALATPAEIAQPATPEPADAIPIPVVAGWTGGGSPEGSYARVWIRLPGEAHDVEYVRATQASALQAAIPAQQPLYASPTAQPATSQQPGEKP